MRMTPCFSVRRKGKKAKKMKKKGRGPAKVEKSVKLLAKVFGSKSKASSILEGLGKYDLVVKDESSSSSSTKAR